MCVVRNPIKICFILAAAVLLQSSAAGGDEAVSLQDLITELLQNNPQIQAAESKHQAALARPSQMRTLPDPVVSFVTRNMSGNPIPFTKLGEEEGSSIGVMWEQEIPFPGKLKLAGEIAEQEAGSVEAELAAVRWNAISELKQAFYEYFRTDRSLEVLEESLDLLKHFESIAQARYGVGEGIQQDVLRAQVEISILNQRTTMLEQERNSAIADMNRLLNKPIDSPMGKPMHIQPSILEDPLEQLQSRDSLKSPVIRSGEAMVQREKLSLDLAKKQYRPDFMGSLEYADSPNFPDMWEVQFGVRIPVFYKKKQRYGVIESAQNLTRAEKELTAMKQEVGFNIKNEYLQIQASEKLLKLYGKAIIPQSNLALESAIASYQVGKVDFLTTLSNFLILLEYRINYFEELSKHESAIARLEQTIGRPLVGAKETASQPPPNTTQGGSNHE